jgi:hypothetical protein
MNIKICYTQIGAYLFFQVVIFVFAHPLIRKKAFNYFWLTHQVSNFIFYSSQTVTI